MAVAPRLAGLKLPSASPGGSVHTLELFLDYVCPFSKKMFDTVYTSVAPTVQSNYAKNLSIIFRPQIQPWHPSSTLVHEAAVAVLLLNGDKFWPFSKALFDKQIEFFDVNVVNEPRNKTYERLADIASGAGVNRDEFLKLLLISDKPDGDSYNSGNKVTNDIKKIVKANRLVGVHATPTVLFDGVVEPGIESSFSTDDWKEWLKKNVV